MPWWSRGFRGAPTDTYPRRIEKFGDRVSVAPDVATCAACAKQPTQTAFGTTPLCLACAIMADNEGRVLPE